MVNLMGGKAKQEDADGDLGRDHSNAVPDIAIPPPLFHGQR